MDRISVLRAFTRLVERGSFTAVADELRVKQSTVSKWLRGLEDELGVQLVDRTTRAVHITDAGRRFYDKALTVLAAYDDALEVLAPSDDVLRGRLRVSVPEVFGRLYVVPQVTRFVRRHKELELDLTFADQYVSLVEQGFDVAIRVGRAVDSTLQAHPLASTERVLVASPGYLKQHGAPSSPKALREHACLTHSGALGDAWSFLRGGRTQRVSVRGRVSTNNSEAALALARSGLGLCLLATWLVDADLRSGRLVPVLEAYEAPPAPIRALTPPGRRVPTRVRAFIEHLREGFAAALP
ncbi:MAG: LysR family transcriptional regulator [Myxococcota bacterium]